MSRTPFVAGNWKMHKTGAEAASFVRQLAPRIPGGVETAVCAPFTGLAGAVEAAAGTGIGVYAQNMHQALRGAFTGEVSAAMLLDLGVDGVLLGHSERRSLFGETDSALAEKLPAAHAAGLRVIFAVGETQADREQDATDTVLARQLGALGALSPEQVAATTIAYEPVWAIGTGLTASPAMAQAAHGFIRAAIEREFGVGARVRIQYGGSLKPDNAAGLIAQPDIDGGLIGGASLEVEQFAGILDAVRP
jgi:triosephosphate isomerase (TIM)